LEKEILNQQSQHWEQSFSSKSEMFGLEPSIAAVKAIEIFKKNKISSIIELGAGLGRDTIFFAQNLIKVEALDYSSTAINIINQKAKKYNLSKLITARVYDIRKKIPFKNNFIQGCFSHMLYCMALTNSELENLNNEIYRILRPSGINIYTVRNTNDEDYKNGVHRGENLYENDGFIIHFFSKEKINTLLNGFKNISIESFEEGKFPRKLFMVQNKKN